MTCPTRNCTICSNQMEKYVIQSKDALFGWNVVWLYDWNAESYTITISLFFLLRSTGPIGDTKSSHSANTRNLERVSIGSYLGKTSSLACKYFFPLWYCQKIKRGGLYKHLQVALLVFHSRTTKHKAQFLYLYWIADQKGVTVCTGSCSKSYFQLVNPGSQRKTILKSWPGDLGLE